MVPSAFLRDLIVAMRIGTRSESVGTLYQPIGKNAPTPPEIGTKHVEYKHCKNRLKAREYAA